MTAIRRLAEREPVRLYVYSVAAAIVGGLVVFGLVDDQGAVVLLGIVGTVLAVPATEAARARVVPTAKLATPPTHGDAVAFLAPPGT